MNTNTFQRLCFILTVMFIVPGGLYAQSTQPKVDVSKLQPKTQTKDLTKKPEVQSLKPADFNKPELIKPETLQNVDVQKIEVISKKVESVKPTGNPGLNPGPSLKPELGKTDGMLDLNRKMHTKPEAIDIQLQKMNQESFKPQAVDLEGVRSLDTQVKSDTTLQKKFLGELAIRPEISENIREGKNLAVEQTSLSERSGLSDKTTGGSTLGERGGLTDLQRNSIRDRVNAQVGLNPGRTAGLNDRARTTEGSWKVTKTQGFADTSGDITGKKGTMYATNVSLVSENGVSVLVQFTHDGGLGEVTSTYFNDKTDSFVIGVGLGENNSGAEHAHPSGLEGLAMDVADLYTAGIVADHERTQADAEANTARNSQQVESEVASRLAARETSDPAHAAEGSTTATGRQSETEGEKADQGNTILVEHSEDEDGNQTMVFESNDDGNDDSADGSDDEDPDEEDSGATERMADGDAPSGRRGSTPWENQGALDASVGSSGPGNGTVRTGDDVPRGGASQTAGTSGGSSTVRIDPETVSSAEINPALLKMVEQANNPEGGQGGIGTEGAGPVSIPGGGTNGPGPVVNPSLEKTAGTLEASLNKQGNLSVENLDSALQKAAEIE